MADESFVELTTVAENRDAVVALAGLARRQLAIFTHELEPQLYDDAEFLEAARQLALAGRGARVRILLKDSTRMRLNGSRLVALARQLPSYMEFRKPHADYMGLNETFVVADERGLLHRKLADRWEGSADLDDPARAREKLKLFEEIWQRSNADPEARQLRV